MAGSNGKNRNGKADTAQPAIRCAIYTRKSTNENLDSSFNSLDAQREACELYIQAQTHEGWIVLPDRYDDGAYSGATMERPSIRRLLRDVESGKIDIVVVYKIDRLSRNLLEFNQTLNFFEGHNASFASVTEQFNTQTPMGRFAMNMISSISQMEREVIAERIRDKVAASKRRGMYMGGVPPLGYNVDRKNKRLIVNTEEAALVRFIFRRYLQLRSAVALTKEINDKGLTTKSWTTKKGIRRKGRAWNKSHIYRLLNNPIYIGQVKHKDKLYPGEHDAIIENSLWDEVQKAIGSEGKSGTSHSQTPALLKGILTCGHCGTSMGITYTKKGGKRYRYYLCQQANKNGYDECPIRSVPAGDIENLVLMQVRRMLGTSEMVAETFRQVARREAATRKELETRAAELNKEMSTLQSAAERLRTAGNGSSELMADELSGIEAKIEHLTSELTSIETEQEFYVGQPLSEQDLGIELRRLDGLWDELFPGERKRIIRLLVDEVVVAEDGIDIALQAEGVEGLALEMKGEEPHAECH